MRILRLQIRRPHGQIETIHLEGDRALIGSGAHCEVRLPIDQASPEHVLLEVGAGVTPFVRALTFEPPPTINGIAFTQAPLPPDAVLGLAQTQIQVSFVEQAAGAVTTSTSKGSSPITLFALLVIIAAGGYVLLDEPAGEKTAAPPERTAPELWAAPSSACAQAGPQALAFARERLAVADAKRERRPFHVQDGVQAVPLYETAAACFRAGGDAQTAQLAESAAQYLRRDVADDYRTRRVRLEHALSIEDFELAAHETHVLLQFTEGKSGEYVQWLTALERKLKLRVGRQAPQ